VRPTGSLTRTLETHEDPAAASCRVFVVAVKEWSCSTRARREEVGVLEVGDRGPLRALAIGEHAADGRDAENHGNRQEDQ
jgi:hypothetical protein